MSSNSSVTTYGGGLAVLVECASSNGAGSGVLFRSARGTTPADVLAMAVQGRGICTVTVDEPTAMRLNLRPQSQIPRDPNLPYFVNSVEARACRETGISAAERALTMDTLGSPELSAELITSPGHVMVQVACNVFRPGASLSEHAYMLVSARTETRFPGWCDILDDSGEIAPASYCRELARSLPVPCFDAAEVRAYGRRELADWVRALEFSRDRYR